MKNGLSAKNLILSILVTILLLYFMAKSTSPRIIFFPFLICSISMAGKSFARILNKQKLEHIFAKLFVLGFCTFFIGFLVLAGDISIRDKNYSMLVFSIPFWIVGIYLMKNKFLNKKRKKNGRSVLSFAIVISALLVAAALLVGIVLLVLGFKETNTGLLFGGIIFTFGSCAFVLAALTMHGCFDKLKTDVFGLYAGVVFVVIGTGFMALKYMETYSIQETIRSFRLWITIPIMMTAAGVIQIVKCLKNRK